MFNRITSIALLCVLMLCMIPTAYASSFAREEILTPIDLSGYEEATSTPSSRAGFQVVCKDLALGKYALSGEYTVKSGVDKCKVNFTWTPTTQKIQIGFLNPQKTFYKVDKTGGEYKGTLGTTNAPSGTYKVAVFNPTSNTKKINGIANCEWTK